MDGFIIEYTYILLALVAVDGTDRGFVHIICFPCLRILQWRKNICLLVKEFQTRILLVYQFSVVPDLCELQ